MEKIKMLRNALFQKGWMILLVAVLAGCSSPQKARFPDNPDPIIEGDLTEEKVERALKMKLAKQREFQKENQENYKEQVVQLPAGDKTYYYKYYDEFPEDTNAMSVTIIPTETYSPLYRAEVKYRKVRYQTRYTKSRGRAAKDEDFVRDQGIQKETYEFGDNLWQLRQSVFEVTKTSVYKENRWTASQGRLRRIEEEKPELFVDKVRTLFGLLD